MTIKQNWLILLFALVVSGAFTACSDDDDEDLVGNWVQRSVLDGIARSSAVAFTIGDNAYVGTGFNGTESTRLKDFWQYDTEKDMWSPIADFPGDARTGAVAFSINGKGYVGTGYAKVTNTDGTTEMAKMKDFYEYDPTNDTWTRIADFAGSGRYGAVAFSIDGYGYVGTGYDGNVLKDFYRYDPSANTWTAVASIRGSKRQDAVAFVLNGKAYVVTGIANGKAVTDFYEYDPATDYWTEKREIADVSSDSYDDDYTIAGYYCAAFTIDGKGYVATGGAGSAGAATWEYNPLTDLWEEKSNFEGSSRTYGVGFTINERGYLTTGRTSGSGYYFDDLWEFFPDAEQDDED